METNEALERCEKFSHRRWDVAVLLSFFAGGFGADRFYLGYRWLGVLKLLTLGGLGLWGFADFVLLLYGKRNDADGLPLVR